MVVYKIPLDKNQKNKKANIIFFHQKSLNGFFLSCFKEASMSSSSAASTSSPETSSQAIADSLNLFHRGVIDKQVGKYNERMKKRLKCYYLTDWRSLGSMLPRC